MAPGNRVSDRRKGYTAATDETSTPRYDSVSLLAKKESRLQMIEAPKGSRKQIGLPIGDMCRYENKDDVWYKSVPLPIHAMSNETLNKK